MLNGVDVKQVFGLECGRSPLTGVGFILRDGTDALKEQSRQSINMSAEFKHKNNGVLRENVAYAGEMGDDPTGGKSSKLLRLSCPTDGGETCSLILL